jgi:hypothetical protein
MNTIVIAAHPSTAAIAPADTETSILQQRVEMNKTQKVDEKK